MLQCESLERVDETGTERKSGGGHEEETQRAPERAARHRSGPRESAEVLVNAAAHPLWRNQRTYTEGYTMV